MVKICIMGFGSIGRKVLKVALEKGATVSTVLNKKSYVGQSAGEIIGLSNVDLIIQPLDKAEEILSANKPDVSILTISLDLSKLEPYCILCAKLGINLITSCDEAFFPEFEDSKVATNLDEAFKKGGCTMLGTGFEDGIWSQPFVNLGGLAHNLREIHLEYYADMITYVSNSPDKAENILVNFLGFGLTQEEFHNNMTGIKKEGKHLGGIMGTIPAWLCSVFKWTFSTGSLSCNPIVSQKNVFVAQLGKEIPAGRVIGYEEIITYETNEGIKIKICGRFGVECEDYVHWFLKADPDIEVKMKKPLGVDFTVNIAVNRIPDVINARPGYITTTELLPVRYRESLR